MIGHHNDGLGFMRREEGRIITERTVGSNLNKFDMFRRWRNYKSYAMHARFRTHGKVNEENCHPFKILDMDDGDSMDMYVMHNGVIRDYPDVEKDSSDTFNFMKYVIVPLAKANPEVIWENEHWQGIIHRLIGGSRLLFMRSDDHPCPVLIFNKSAGTTQGQCWLSNGHSTSHHYTRTSTTHTHIDHQSRRNDYTPPLSVTATSSTTKAKEKEDLFDWDNYTLTRYGAPVDMIRCNRDGKHNAEGYWFRDEVGDIRYAGSPQGDATQRGKLYMPDATGKVIELVKNTDTSGKESYEKKPEEFFVIQGEQFTVAESEHLYNMLSTMRGLSNGAAKQVMQDDPDMTYRIILLFYDKNTMDYSTIFEQIYDEAGVMALVNLIKNLSAEKDKITRLLKQA